MEVKKKQKRKLSIKKVAFLKKLIKRKKYRKRLLLHTKNQHEHFFSIFLTFFLVVNFFSWIFCFDLLRIFEEIIFSKSLKGLGRE